MHHRVKSHCDFLFFFFFDVCTFFSNTYWINVTCRIEHTLVNFKMKTCSLEANCRTLAADVGLTAGCHLWLPWGQRPLWVKLTVVLLPQKVVFKGFQDGVERRRWGARMDSGGPTASISFVHRFWNERATSAYWVYNQQVTGHLSMTCVSLFTQIGSVITKKWAEKLTC